MSTEHFFTSVCVMETLAELIHQIFASKSLSIWLWGLVQNKQVSVAWISNYMHICYNMLCHAELIHQIFASVSLSVWLWGLALNKQVTTAWINDYMHICYNMLCHVVAFTYTSSLLLKYGLFYSKSSQNTPHSSPMRVRYGLSFVRS